MIRSKAIFKKPGTRWPDGPLLDAVRNDDCAAVRTAIESSADSVDDVTWLHHFGAINFVKSHDVLTVLIDAGITINEQVLVHYLSAGYRDSDFSVEVLQGIIDAGAPVNGQRDEIRGLHHKSWPIQAAIHMGKARQVEVLLRNGADPNILFLPEKIAPLHWVTVYWGMFLDDQMVSEEQANSTYRHMVNQLLDHGADIECRTASGLTPLLYAADVLSSVVFHSV